MIIAKVCVPKSGIHFKQVWLDWYVEALSHLTKIRSSMPELKQRPIKQSNTFVCIHSFHKWPKAFLAEICRASLICSMKVRTVMLCKMTLDMQWFNDFDNCYIGCGISLSLWGSIILLPTTWFVAKHLYLKVTVNFTKLITEADSKNLSKTKEKQIPHMRNVFCVKEKQQ